MTWYAFRNWANNSYPPVNVAGLQEKTLTVWGFHGYATQAQAVMRPNSVNFANASIVATIEKDYQAALSTGMQPGGPNANIGRAVTNPAGFAKDAIAADLLHGFNFGNWILRIGEILLGAVLIGVGVAKLTGTDNVISSALKVVK